MLYGILVALLVGCGGRKGEDCACAMPAHGTVDDDDRCLCLPLLPATVDPEPSASFQVAENDVPDWDSIDAALAKGPVYVRFAEGTWDERLLVARTDRSENRLVLDGGGAGQRAIMPGITTGYDDAFVSHVTVRGFEVTGSRDKGVFWQAGDQVLLEDLVVHDNKGSPAVNLNYSNRTGHRSTGFTLRNSHVYNQPGECVYMGGSEGEDEPSHEYVLIENNLIHDCYSSFDTKHDGINVKDNIGDVLVRRNVVFHADWGIEVASPGLYEHNVVFDVDREGFQVGDYFGAIADLTFENNAVLDVGHDGFHIAAEYEGIERISLLQNTILGAGEAGVLFAGPFDVQVTVNDVVVAGGPVGFDGWDDLDVTIDGCAIDDLDEVDDRSADGLADCTSVKTKDWSRPAGPDNIFFTADDPWILDGVGAQLPVD